MADPVSITTGVIRLHYLTIALANILQENNEELPKEVKDVEQHTKALAETLTELHNFLRSDECAEIVFHADSGLSTVLQGCQLRLENLENKLRKWNTKFSSSLSSSAVRLTGAMGQGECIEASQWLQDFTQTFQFCLVNNNCEQMSKPIQEVIDQLKMQALSLSQLTKRNPAISNGFERLSKELKCVETVLQSSHAEVQRISNSVMGFPFHANSQTRNDILDWLSPLQPTKRHQDLHSSRLSGTCEWILQQREFLDWISASPVSQNFCFFGDPGVGKTYAMSRVVDELLDTSHRVDGLKIGVAYVYCDYRDRSYQNEVHILGALVQQLLSSLSEISVELLELFDQKHPHQKHVLELADAIAAFTSTRRFFDRIYICLDALDECTDISKLLQLFSNTPSVRTFITGRKHMQKVVLRSFGKAYVIPVETKPQDIKAYVKSKTTQSYALDSYLMDSKLSEEIATAIAKKSQGVFLLSTLSIGMVLEAQTKAKRRSALGRLPYNLSRAFNNVIERIQNQPNDISRQAMKILTWVHLAERPLTVDELLHALATEYGHTELQEDNFPSRNRFLDSCLGLVVVDSETSTVRLCHRTLKEYLDSKQDLLWPNGQEEITMTCLTYVMFEMKFGRKNGAVFDPNQIARLALFKYAVTQWGNHARKCPPMHQGTIDMVIKFLSLDTARRIHSDHILGQHMQTELDEGHPELADGVSFFYHSLHIASYFGIRIQLIDILLGRGEEVEIKDFYGRTPLSYAAERGHLEVSRRLLERGARADSKDDYMGMTPLCLATKNGHDKIVALLLGHKVDINSQDLLGRSPLSLAVVNGHRRVLKALLQYSHVNPDLKDHNGRTPLSYAVERADEKVTEVLLDFGANLALKDKDGRTSISWAAETATAGVVDLLLQRGAHADFSGQYGRRPLSLACANGNLEVVKLLLDRDDVDADLKDDFFDRTPLSWASESGHEKVVEQLLKHEVDVNSKGEYNRTPLTYAARKGHDRVVFLLLKQKGIQIDAKDAWGCTPLSLAARYGYDLVVRLLLEHGANVKAKDIQGRSPISFAAEGGSTSVIDILIANGADPNSKDDEYGRTPLSWAAEEGHGLAIEIFLKQEAILADVGDNEGRTPISLAASRGHLAAVELLLDCKDVDVDSKDNEGRTPLCWTLADSVWEAGHEQEKIAHKLLERGAKSDSKDSVSGRTPLSWAAENGYETVVRAMLEKSKTEINSKDDRGRTPLWYATVRKNEPMIRLLLRSGAEVDLKDNLGRTPLSYAVQLGRRVAARILLARGANPNSQDQNGLSPLAWAETKGRNSMIELLVSYIPEEETADV